MCDMGIGLRLGTLLGFVLILGALAILVQRETQPVDTLVADGQIWEDKVAGRCGPIQIDHASNWCAGQHGCASLIAHASVGDRSSLLQSREKEVVGVHCEGNVVLLVLALEYLQLNNRRWVDGAAIGGCCDKMLGQT